MIGYILSLVIIIFCLTFMFSLLLTAAVHSYASHRLLDIPNQRSSHTVLTPRGGGLAIGIVFIAAIVLSSTLVNFPDSLAIAMIGGSLLVAVVGWIDDHRHVAARWRILIHFAAATWAVYWLDGFPSIDVGYMVLPLGWAGHFLAIVGIVWLINLYNFMDGIDGLAAGEAVTVALVAAGLLWWKGVADVALIAALFAAACGGFLWWNWQPARIFMGDVGSGLLGYCFAVLMLASEKSAGAGVPVIVWLILLAVFVLDATFTLAGRIIRGESWYTAHRLHAYQRLTQSGYSHATVAGGVMLINLLLLAPLAGLAVFWPDWAAVILAAVTVAGWLVWKTIQHRFGKTSA